MINVSDLVARMLDSDPAEPGSLSVVFPQANSAHELFQLLMDVFFQILCGLSGKNRLEELEYHDFRRVDLVARYMLGFGIDARFREWTESDRTDLLNEFFDRVVEVPGCEVKCTLDWETRLCEDFRIVTENEAQKRKVQQLARTHARKLNYLFDLFDPQELPEFCVYFNIDRGQKTATLSFDFYRPITLCHRQARGI